MDSGYIACTDLNFGEMAVIKRIMTIPLVWKIENFSRYAWDQLSRGTVVCGLDFKSHPLSKVLWKLEILKKCEPGLRYGPVMDMTKVNWGFEEDAVSQFTIYWRAKSKGVTFWEKKVSVPTNAKNRGFQEVFAVAINDFKNISSYSFFNMIVQIEADDNIARETDNYVPDLQSLNKDKVSVVADFISILKKDQLTDISLRSEGKDIPAHRAILAAKSAVFRGMFESENFSGFVDISDISFETLQLLVSYMYSGRLVEDLDVKSASELFVASDKYAVEDLHSTCSLFLKSILTVENCLQILMLADTHSNEDLRSSTVTYFSEHSKEICQKPDWKNVIKVRPNVMFELLEVLALK